MPPFANHVSAFIDKLIENGYEYTDLSILLNDINIHDDDNNVATIFALLRCGYVVDRKLVQIIATAKISIDRILFICDELAAYDIVYGIIRLGKLLNSISEDQIINYTKSNRANYFDMIHAHCIGYKIIMPDNLVRNTFYNGNLINDIITAYNNGLYSQHIMLHGIELCNCDITKNNIYSKIMKDEIIEATIIPNYTANNLQIGQFVLNVMGLFPDIKKMHVHCVRENSHDKSTICVCDNTLRLVQNIESLTTNCIDQQILNMFVNLTHLDASHNNCITTCEPFAKTLRVLDASFSTLDDRGLKLCTNIKHLTARNNKNITTCRPFPNLRFLDASESCIDDYGLIMCTRIRKLIICESYSGRKITTCAPFASTLKILCVGNSSTITTTGLSACTKLKVIHCNDAYQRAMIFKTLTCTFIYNPNIE